MFQLYIFAFLCACLDLITADEWGNVDWGSLQGDWGNMNGDWGAMEAGAGIIPSWDHRVQHTIKGGKAPWAENVYHFRKQAQNNLKSDYRPLQTNTLLNSMTSGQRKSTQATMWDSINNSQKLHDLNQAIDVSNRRLAAINRAIESQRLEELKRSIDAPRTMNWNTNTNSKSPDSINLAFGASSNSPLSQKLAAVSRAIKAGTLEALKQSIDTLTPAQKAENRRKQFQQITNNVGLGIMSLGSMSNQPFGMLPWGTDQGQGAGYRLGQNALIGGTGRNNNWMTIAQGISSPYIPNTMQDLSQGLVNLLG